MTFHPRGSVVSAVTVLLMTTAVRAETPAGGLPFTVSKETSVITGLVDGRGMPDYLKVLQGEIGCAEGGG